MDINRIEEKLTKVVNTVFDTIMIIGVITIIALIVSLISIYA